MTLLCAKDLRLQTHQRPSLPCGGVVDHPRRAVARTKPRRNNTGRGGRGVEGRAGALCPGPLVMPA